MNTLFTKLAVILHSAFHFWDEHAGLNFRWKPPIPGGCAMEGFYGRLLCKKRLTSQSVDVSVPELSAFSALDSTGFDSMLNIAF